MSIQRIAELAGVSIATVSNALNGTGRVSSGTAEKIRKIAERENLTTRPKRRVQPREKKHITFTIADKAASLRHSTFNMHIFEGVQARLESAGYSVVLFSRVDVNNICRHTKDSAGIIMMGHDPQPQAFFDAAKKPLVWVSRYETGTADTVLENNREIGRIAAHHLLGRGHKVIAYVDDEYIQTVSDRGRHFARYVREGGGKPVVLRDKLIFDIVGNHPVINTDKLDRVMAKMLAEKERPTALFSPGDMMTLSIYAFLKRNSIMPMKDIDIISCNNEMPYIREMSPRPPTIDFNLHFMGSRAADTLLWRMSNPDAPPQKILIAPRLLLPGE